MRDLGAKRTLIFERRDDRDKRQVDTGKGTRYSQTETYIRYKRRSSSRNEANECSSKNLLDHGPGHREQK
jgi:hypothetical protein